MNFLSYIQGLIGNSYVVTDELNYVYDGTYDLVIIKYLTGSNYKDSVIQPIQLNIYTRDVNGARAFFDSFTKTYNNTNFIQGLEYIVQFYSTPMVMTTFQNAGNNFSSQIIVSGTLVISSNVSDIKTVYIDGVEYETTSRIVSYVGNADNQRKASQYINETNIKTGMVKFNCTMINKANAISQKVRNIRTGAIDIDTTFTITLLYNDNETEEEYVMKLDSATVNSENQILPILSLSFMK